MKKLRGSKAVIEEERESGKNGETSQGSSYFREDFPLSSDRRKMVPRTEIAHTMTYNYRAPIERGRALFLACARQFHEKCLITIGN